MLTTGEEVPVSKPPAKAAAASKTAAKAAEKPVAAPAAAKTTKAAPAKTTEKAAPTAPPAPTPAPPANRFTDRFAPARAPSKPMTETADLPKTDKPKADPKLANAWKTKPGRDLTEAELLAMPDSEYMNEKQLDFFRAALQKQKDDLLSNAGETTEHLREDTSIVPDPADRATIEEEHALELRTRDRERKLLKKISQSLARLESGEYGYCDETGEPIGLARLLARPTATLSLEAQQRRELKQKMFGD
jgi:DnaK suppressor protein